MKSFKKGRSKVSYDDTGLKEIKKLFKGKDIPTIKVGILGNGNIRDENDGPTNAYIGSVHELGLGHNPIRSWLRAPLINHYAEELKKSGFFDNEDALKESIANNGLKPLFEKMAIVAENVVTGAFDSSGYGTWKPSNMSRKKNHQTLVETQQLRDSITSEVK